MTRTKRSSSTFPPEMMQLYMHVANTGKRVVIKNLGPRREDYVSFRARMHEFRNAYRSEAQESGDRSRITIAEAMYAVTLRNPEKDSESGQWYLVVETRERKLSDAIREVLPAPDPRTLEPTEPESQSAGAKAIDALFNDDTNNPEED